MVQVWPQLVQLPPMVLLVDTHDLVRITSPRVLVVMAALRVLVHTTNLTDICLLNQAQFWWVTLMVHLPTTECQHSEKVDRALLAAAGTALTATWLEVAAVAVAVPTQWVQQQGTVEWEDFPRRICLPQ